ncbi:MAG TPA: PEP/pyruvate-binding domain-containing protein [Candidatus Omnitrophota bacterium]|nr:PEP/pyruvate-binding domain-containing protein [Candidatus Omnitrophota bacterium]
MQQHALPCNTGLPGLDKILGGIRLGDNVVFQIDRIDDYIRLVEPFAKAANQNSIPLIYFRFADHPPVLPAGASAHIYELHPEKGFENFLSEILTVIEHFGKGAFYIFDCLSELAVDWYSDRMLGNFFMITCPYLFDFDTVAYFALLREDHTPLATDAIHRTAQVVLDLYRNKDIFYIHPQKVEGRHSSTMYMLHKWDHDDFVPVTKSTTTAEILTSVSQPWLDFSIERRDVWARNFLNAQDVIRDGSSDPSQIQNNKALFLRLLRMVITRDQRVLDLAEKYFDFTDLVEIGKRLIGTGLIGGKSVGMLLARAIVRKEDPRLAEFLEPHDSFFIGSDVFYTYLITNKCWWPRHLLNVTEQDCDSADEVRDLLLKGEFPQDIQDQFMEMIEYFGQSPIIVRSSSLLEDAYGNAFSGKYDSVFCTNQGTPEERLANFMAAVRTVYASTVSKEALAYRAHWDLLKQDEQMALLVQRVSGEVYQDQYFPQIAGVGFSFNPFVWDREIDPKAGMLRLVFGLGTRAVDRVEDDYTRIVALNAPLRRPEATSGDVRKYAQHKIDILDLKTNALITKDFRDVVDNISDDFPIEVFASQDEDLLRQKRDNDRIFCWILTFEELLSKKAFVEDMRKMIALLQQAYSYPVDIEFTANFLDKENYRINLLQCRPFQVKGNILNVDVPETIPQDRVILKTHGPVIGSSRATTIDRIIYVVPDVYGKMKPSDRYSVARLIGRLTHLEDSASSTVMLIGPGRWATSTPELGVPVSFAEIDRVSILCEVAAMHENLIPEVSLGTHFFNDLVEMDMLYLAVYPQRKDNIINDLAFSKARNILTDLLPDAAPWASVVHVIDSSGTKQEHSILLHADVLQQNAICYFS